MIEARIRAHLRQYMTERKLDQVRMAARLGVKQSTVSRVLNRDRGIGFGLALKISKAIRVAMPILLEEDPAPEFWDSDMYPGR